jgi:hypothetical protein
MCWNKEVSFGTFILGTIFNIIAIICIPNPTIISISIMWEFAILMQLFDGLIWIDQKCGKLNKFATRAAFTANILQPVILFMGFIIISPSNTTMKLVAAILITGYLSYILFKVSEMNKLGCVKPECGSLGNIDTSNDFFSNILSIFKSEEKSNITCKPNEHEHLAYHWWEEMYGFIHVIVFFSVGLLLIRPWIFCLLELGYIFISLVISFFIYNKNSSTIANMWCFFAAFGPLFTIVFWKISEKYTKK